jgi:hypothetical protein
VFFTTPGNRAPERHTGESGIFPDRGMKQALSCRWIDSIGGRIATTG